MIKITENSIFSFETQRAIAVETEAGQIIIDDCLVLIALYEGKIKAVIEHIWRRIPMIITKKPLDNIFTFV